MGDPFLLILTGPSGAGKSTVARSIASRFVRSAVIESDWFWTTIVSGFIPPWQAEADLQNQAMIRSTMAAAARMADSGYCTIVDGIVGPWYFDLVRDELEGIRVPTLYAVLRPDLGTCLARATGRAGHERMPGHPPLTDEQAVRQMWLQFADLGDNERSVIDTTLQAPGETAALVHDRLSAGGRSLAFD